MQGAVNNEQYPELIEMLLSGDIRTFQERLQSFIDQLPDNKRSANKKGFFPLFVLGGFLALPDTKLGRDLGVKQAYYHVEKNTVGYISGVKFVIPIEKQDNKKLLFVVVSENPHIQFTPEEISYMRSKLGHDRYDSFSKIGYSIPIEHPSPTEYQSNVKIGKIKGIDRQTFTQKRVSIDTGKDFLLLKNRIRKVGEDLENLISECSSSNEEKVQNGIKEVSNYFDPVVQEYIIRKSGHFKHESDYHGLFAGFFVMLFKYRYNLKSYLELSLGEGFSDIVVLVRSTERSDNAIPIIIELKAGKTLTIQGTPFDQAGKYAEAFKYGPQRMITNNDNVIYAVYNPDLPNNRIKIDKAARDKQHPKPFLQSVLESADPAQIREQLKYTYYSIPNLAENYYRYTSEVLLGELIPVRTTREVWNKYIFQYDRGVSNDITSFGFVNSGKNELVLLNIIRSDSRSKKINIDEVIEKNEEVNVKLGMHESIGGNRNLKIREVNLLLETKKERAGEFKNWCRKVQVNSYDNLDNYNKKKTQSFSGEFAKLDIDVNKLKNMLDNAVDKKGTGTQSDNAEHYKKLFTEVSSTVFPIKEMINNEIDFQAILHGLFMYYSDSQMSGGSKKRIGVIPEVQSGSGKRIDIGVIGGKEFTGIELKFSETQGIADGLTKKAKEAESQLDRYKKQPNNVKSLTDSERAKMFWAVFHKGASTRESLIETRDKFDVFQVVHSSMHVIPHLQPEDILEQSRDIFNQQCNGNRKKRNINMACVDSRDEEKITEGEKEQRIKELFSTDKVVEKVKNIEFYDKLFKVSQQISKGEIVDKNVEEAFVARIKDIDLNSIDSEIRDIVKEMKDNIENKEEVKNILRRSGVAEKIGKVAEGAGLAFTAFLVGKHIANGDIEGLGYDALNLWVMPKIGEKISGKMLELGTKLDSQMLKGFAPAMGRAIGNFAAFLGLAESIKARQNAIDPVDIKIADLNIATNSIFIAADVPAIVTETMSAVGAEAGVIGEFTGPVGAAISVAVIIIAQFVEAGLEVEKLEEHINLTDQEKHDLYWGFFLGKKLPDYIENDIEAKSIYKQYVLKLISQYKDNYDKIVMSLPNILVTKEKRGDAEIQLFKVYCRTNTKIVDTKFDFGFNTNVKYPFHISDINSRMIPANIESYSVVCGPRDSDVKVQVDNPPCNDCVVNGIGSGCDNLYSHSNVLLNRTFEKWFLQEYPSDCYNAVIYRNTNSRGYGSMYYIPSQNVNIDVVFQKNDALNGDRNRRRENRYYFEKSLDSCKVHNPGSNFFYITGKFSCDLGADGQKNIVVTQGNFTDSENIHYIIGSDKANHIEVSHAGYVDGKGGNDVITAKNFTAIKGYFGDSIHGKGLVLLPINPSDIGNVTHANNITNIYNKSGAFISVDKQILVKTADGSFVTPTKVDDKTGVVTNLHVTKSFSGDVVLDDELDNLRKIDNSNFNITKQLSSANYHSTIGSSSNHIFYPDKEHHNFYWEAPSNISHLYLFDNRNANITIAQANGILDFSQLNSTLNDMPFIENDKGEIKINKNGLNVTLLPDYKDVTVTFDGEEYYKLQNGELERGYCSHSLRIDGRFSVNGTDLLNHHNCFTFDSDKVLFLKLNNDLLLLSDRGALSISDYYSSVHKNWDLSIELSDKIMEPEEFGERADEFSSFRYYQPDEQGLQIYHNQPINKNDIGLVDLKGKSILDFDIKVMNDTLLLSHKNNTLVKLENWNTYQPAREMMFGFNDATVSNSKCIVSTCNSEDIVMDFNKEKIILQISNAIKQNNINAKDKDGKTLFHIVVNKGDLSYAKLLVGKIESMIFEESLYAESDKLVKAVRQRERLRFLINEKDKLGYTPLQYAAKDGKWDIVNLFLDKTAERNQDDVADKNKFSTSWTTMHYAVYNGNMDLLNDIFQFLSDKETIINTKDNSDWTPLHYAVYYNALDVVKFLVGKGADISARDKDGKIPLDLATQENGTGIAEFLKQTQLDLDKQLLTAVQDRNLSKAEVLVSRGANINTKNDDGYTSLHFAVLKNFQSGIDYLIKKGANIDAKDNLGRTPLHWAARDGYLGIVQAITEGGANLDVKDKDNKTPSDLASWKGYKNIAQYLKQVQLDKKLLAAAKGNDYHEVQILVSQGASLEAKDRNGRTSLYMASWNGNLDVVKYLIGKGSSINVKDKDGKTPLGIAIERKYNDVVACLQQILNEQLLAAIENGNLNTIKNLISEGANVNAKGTLVGISPMHLAVENQDIDFIEFLLSKKADINNTDGQGRTPLFWASYSGYSDVVRYLIDQGANVNIKNQDGKTALDIARDKSHYIIVMLLEKEINKEREKPAQRKRRHHHGDHNHHHMSRKPLAIDSSDQPEVTASSGTRPSSWINNCISWAKKLAASTFSIIPALPSQYNIADKNNVKSDNKNIPQSTSSVGWNKFLNNENIALASCVADALDNTPSRRYQGLMSKGVEVVPSSRVAVEFALKKFNSFVEDKIINLESKEQARIRVELKDAYPEITASLERGVEFSGNVGLDNVLEKCKKCFCTNVLPKDKVSTCLSGVGVTKLENNLSR